MRRFVLCVALLVAAPAPATAAIHLRGTAYEFNSTPVIAAATIRVAELPSARAVTRADGSYDLAVPDRHRVTPYIVAPGYHTIYLQTFSTRGQDLANVNFQTPTEDVYRALVALLNVPVDAAGNPSQCAIVSTFNTRNVRDLDYREFRAYGAHGVPGATAFGIPTLPPAIYFNPSVLPDPAQPVSSEDGGVVWIGVPSGTYRIRGQAPGTAFAPFTATCAPGRVVNANPPWGLSQLSPASPAQLKPRWVGTTLRSLRVTELPPESTLRATCAGAGCPFARRETRPRGSATTWLQGDRFRPGQTLEVTAFSHSYNATVRRYRITRARPPRASMLCVPDGLSRPQRRCRTG